MKPFIFINLLRLSCRRSNVLLKNFQIILFERNICLFYSIAEEPQVVFSVANWDIVCVVINTKNFYSHIYYQIYMSRMFRIIKTFWSISLEYNVSKCCLIPKPSYCVILCANLDIIHLLFKYWNQLFSKLESHVQLYLNIRYPKNDFLIEVLNLCR